MILCSGAGVCPGIFTCNLLRSSCEVIRDGAGCAFREKSHTSFSASGQRDRIRKRAERQVHTYRSGTLTARRRQKKYAGLVREKKPESILLLGSRESRFQNVSCSPGISRFLCFRHLQWLLIFACGEGICGSCELEE